MTIQCPTESLQFLRAAWKNVLRIYMSLLIHLYDPLLSSLPHKKYDENFRFTLIYIICSKPKGLGTETRWENGPSRCAHPFAVLRAWIHNHSKRFLMPSTCCASPTPTSPTVLLLATIPAKTCTDGVRDFLRCAVLLGGWRRQI